MKHERYICFLKSTAHVAFLQYEYKFLHSDFCECNMSKPLCRWKQITRIKAVLVHSANKTYDIS